MIDKFIGIIAESNPKNPVADYLSESYMNFDGNYEYIQKLCDAIITPKDYSPILKKTLWLLHHFYNLIQRLCLSHLLVVIFHIYHYRNLLSFLCLKIMGQLK